jgi:peptidoglycan-N-acetylglucosamine deacetylase
VSDPRTTPDRRWLLPVAEAAVICGAAIAWLLPTHPLWPLALASTALLAVLVLAVTWIGSGIFGPALIRGLAGRSQVALTFDDGPDPEHTLAIAAILTEAGQRGTFFVVGEQVREHPELVRELVAQGHELGLHSDDHSLTSTLPSMRWLRDDFARSARTLEETVGRSPRFYRPPVGLLNPRIHLVAREGGWQVIGWTVRARDGVPADPRAVAQRIERGLRDGAVILMHDHLRRGGRPAAVEALPRVLETLQARGLRSVPLSELLDVPAWRESG